MRITFARESEVIFHENDDNIFESQLKQLPTLSDGTESKKKSEVIILDDDSEEEDEVIVPLPIRSHSQHHNLKIFACLI
jgi:hypothetical protein